jgi:uroporphyrinogen decarboxylase
VVRHRRGPRLSTITGPEGLKPLKGKDDIHDHLAPVYETVRILSRELPKETTLIGFAGAPWTVATYMIAGRGTPDQARPTRCGRKTPRPSARSSTC